MQTTVTSDPTIADTDEDGLGDAQELLSGSNPRNSDTDGDTIIDPVEIVQWHSSPTKQDTDGDGLSDAGDLVFETSLILADTDGDSMDDREELFLVNRNPLMADLPRPQIVVGDYSLQVEVSSSYTDVTTGSVGTLREGINGMGTERLVRVRGVQNDLRDLDFPEKKFWTIQTNNPTRSGPQSLPDHSR